jgi:hypothetical protein
MKIPMSLFGSFRPTEWNEESYGRRPPFIIETVSGRVFVVPRDMDVEAILDKTSSPLGLKKIRQGRVTYLVSRSSTVKALREFDWYVRRSWQNREYSALWALAYLGEKGDWSRGSLHLKYLAEAAGLTTKQCGDALQKLFHSNGDGDSALNLSEFVSDRKLIQQTLEKKVDELPLWTEEMLMSVLCTGPGGSVADLYESVLGQGLSIGAVYKASERLKTQGYVYPLRHYRVNQRGPMREMLSADCNHCFFGHSNADGCLAESLRQIEDFLESDHGKKPTEAQRAALFSSLKPVPYASRTNRRVIASLRLMREVERTTKDGRVSGMMRRIEEGYGVHLPMKLPQETK